MTRVVVLRLALCLAGAAPGSAALNAGDFGQLMEAAVAASSARSQVQPRTTTICVQRELQPPFEATKRWIKEFEDQGVRQPLTGVPGADQVMIAAMSSRAAVARQTSMPPLPPKFILVSLKTARPADCLIEGAPPRPGWPKLGNDEAVLLTFSRPAFANGYAFIEEHEQCPGLCGATYLRVFKKQTGNWVQVANTLLSVE
jgi:hypothetical protein